MQIAPGNPTFPIVKIAGNACAAHVFEIHDSSELHKPTNSASRCGNREMRAAESESEILATNKFSPEIAMAT
jgi:hypothetical protein